MKRPFSGRLFLAASAMLVVFLLITAQKPEIKRESSHLSRPLDGKPTQTLLNINNITSWHYYDGKSGISPDGGSGVIYPRGTAGVIFQDGIIWGGIQDGQIRVGGQTYHVGTAPGRIISIGHAENPDAPHVRIYRIRNDFRTVSAEELILDAAELFHDGHINQVTAADVDAVMDQYATDWDEWPVEYGAPFYDLNNNEIYEPAMGEEPGLANADQVVWFVCNDLDSIVTNNLYGSPPMGLELQVTIWGYNHSGPLGQCSFRRYRLINKSGSQIDSAYIAQWSDPDIGYFRNDVVGCDSVLSMGFGYNGYATDIWFDTFLLPPPAAGYSFLQGPLVTGKPGQDKNHNGIDDAQDFAIFKFEQIGPGFINLPLTSFGYSGSNITQWAEPSFRIYDGTLQWYNLLRGFIPNNDVNNPIEFTHLNTGQPTKFPLNGDPVAGTGDIDGHGSNFSPGDRLMAMCAGPFVLSSGDTQEVVVALAGGIQPNGNHLTSVAELKQNIQFIQSVYDRGMVFPDASYKLLGHPNETTSELLLQANTEGFTGVTDVEVNLVPEAGSEPGFGLHLFDDGSHHDNLAGDNIWGNTLIVSNRKFPYKGELILQTSAGQQTFPDWLTGVQLRPAPVLKEWKVTWENGRQDARINAGEKVHLAFDIYNPDGINGIDSLQVINLEPTANSLILIFNEGIAPGQTKMVINLPFELQAPPQGNMVSFEYLVQFDHHSGRYSATLPVREGGYHSLLRDTLEVIALSGNPRNLLPVIADPSLLTGHEYLVSFSEDTINGGVDPIWRLTDLSDSTIKLDQMEVGKSPEFDYPIVDGIEWKVFSPDPGFAQNEYNEAAGIVEIAHGGSEITQDEYDEAGAEFGGNTVWHDLNSTGEYYVSSSGYDGGVYWLMPTRYYTTTRDFELRFNEWNGFGAYAFTDNKIAAVPFELWDIGINTPDDPTDDFRMIPFLYPNDSSSAQWGWATGTDNALGYPASDWIYWNDPYDTTSPTGSYENFAATCVASGGAGATYPIDPGSPHSGYYVNDDPIERLVVCDFAYTGMPPPPGTTIRFITTKPTTATDQFKVTAPNPPVGPNAPFSFQLRQNFPNPFNARTQIPLYLSRDTDVRLEIFNVLGQRVKTLIDRKMGWGDHLIPWDGHGDSGTPVGSGIYFYRINVGTFIKTRKLILLK